MLDGLYIGRIHEENQVTEGVPIYKPFPCNNRSTSPRTAQQLTNDKVDLKEPAGAEYEPYETAIS